MPGELMNSIKTIAEKVAGYVNDAAELSVVTEYMDTGAIDAASARPAATTIIKLDGDCKCVVPVHRAADGSEVEIDAALFELHQRNVDAAIEYRARMIQALLQTVKDIANR